MVAMFMHVVIEPGSETETQRTSSRASELTGSRLDRHSEAPLIVREDHFFRRTAMLSLGCCPRTESYQGDSS